MGYNCTIIIMGADTKESIDRQIIGEQKMIASWQCQMASTTCSKQWKAICKQNIAKSKARIAELRIKRKSCKN